MKRIIINMKDQEYGRRLDEAFKELYFDKISSQLKSELPLDENNLLKYDAILIDGDYELAEDEILRIFFTDKRESKGVFKYQNVKIIYENIIKAIDTKALYVREFKEARVINYFTYYEYSCENIFLEKLVNKIKENYRILLINFKQSFDKSNYSLENLLISLKLNNRLNKNINLLSEKIDENYSKIYGLRDPLELENLDEDTIKKFYRELKTLDFDFIIIDLAFEINTKILTMFNEADKNYIQTKSDNIEYLSQSLLYLDRTYKGKMLEKVEINYYSKEKKLDDKIKGKFFQDINSNESIKEIYKGIF